MNIFRKFHFLSFTFIIFTFLSFSRYSIQVLPIIEQEKGRGDIKFTLIHSVSSDFLPTSLERIHSIHILSVLKCYSEGHTFTELQKTLPVSNSLNNIPIVCTASNSTLLEQICKLQIWFSSLFPSVYLLIQVYSMVVHLDSTIWTVCLLKSKKWKQMIIQIKKGLSLTSYYYSLVLSSFWSLFHTSLLLSWSSRFNFIMNLKCKV